VKQTQQIKPPIPHGSHVDCSASLTKLTALQAPIPILWVCVCTPDLGFTGGNTDIVAGTDTDFIGACTPALRQTSPWYLLAGAHSRFGHFAEELHLLPLPGFEHWIIQTVD